MCVEWEGVSNRMSSGLQFILTHTSCYQKSAKFVPDKVRKQAFNLTRGGSRRPLTISTMPMPPPWTLLLLVVFLGAVVAAPAAGEWVVGRIFHLIALFKNRNHPTTPSLPAGSAIKYTVVDVNGVKGDPQDIPVDGPGIYEEAVHEMAECQERKVLARDVLYSAKEGAKGTWEVHALTPGKIGRSGRGHNFLSAANTAKIRFEFYEIDVHGNRAFPSKATIMATAAKLGTAALYAAIGLTTGGVVNPGDYTLHFMKVPSNTAWGAARRHKTRFSLPGKAVKAERAYRKERPGDANGDPLVRRRRNYSTEHVYFYVYCFLPPPPGRRGQLPRYARNLTFASADHLTQAIYDPATQRVVWCAIGRLDRAGRVMQTGVYVEYVHDIVVEARDRNSHNNGYLSYLRHIAQDRHGRRYNLLEERNPVSLTTRDSDGTVREGLKPLWSDELVHGTHYFFIFNWVRSTEATAPLGDLSDFSSTPITLKDLPDADEDGDESGEEDDTTAAPTSAASRKRPAGGVGEGSPETKRRKTAPSGPTVKRTHPMIGLQLYYAQDSTVPRKEWKKLTRLGSFKAEKGSSATWLVKQAKKIVANTIEEGKLEEEKEEWAQRILDAFDHCSKGLGIGKCEQGVKVDRLGREVGEFHTSWHPQGKPGDTRTVIPGCDYAIFLMPKA